jgi:2-C-methyl-D-erythritol 2,4-cyclodiphosphate synthase
MSPESVRIGTGIDVHPFCDGRDLVLGGEKIPYPRGLAGHSDADVLLHAISDALLGAACLGDIGLHFPDSDPSNKDRSSLDILESVAALIAEAGFRVSHVDSCIIAEKPKLSPHYPAMQRNIARCVGLDPGRVGVKATTAEGLGFTGREEGIAAQAVCLIVPVPARSGT